MKSPQRSSSTQTSRESNNGTISLSSSYPTLSSPPTPPPPPLPRSSIVWEQQVFILIFFILSNPPINHNAKCKNADAKCKDVEMFYLNTTLFGIPPVLVFQLEVYQSIFFYNCHRVKPSLLSLKLSFRSLLLGRQTSK